MRLSCGVVCVILCLAVLIQYRSVTDRHTTTAYTALSIASHGKNDADIVHGLVVPLILTYTVINSDDDGWSCVCVVGKSFKTSLN